MNNTPTLSAKSVVAHLKRMAASNFLPIEFTKGGNLKGPVVVACVPSEVGACVANLMFSQQDDFTDALVFEPGRWNHCILEGLTADQALDESARYVDTLEDVKNFLLRKPYNWDGKKEWIEAVRKS